MPFGTAFKPALSGFCEVDIATANCWGMRDVWGSIADLSSAIYDADGTRRIREQLMCNVRIGVVKIIIRRSIEVNVGESTGQLDVRTASTKMNTEFGWMFTIFIGMVSIVRVDEQLCRTVTPKPSNV